MKCISWNVAGLRACFKKGFLDFFSDIDADIFALQEVKALEEQIPFEVDGYYRYLYPAKKKGYSGTLIYTKEKPISVVYGINDQRFDDEGRLITLEYEKFYFINAYVPNVKRSLERLDERIEWEDLYRKYIKSLEQKKPVICCGDFNVAHTEIDIKNAKANIGNAGFTYEERDKFTNLLDSGLIDTFRFKYKDEVDHYTWWSYMRNVRERNIGWRIDYFLISESLKDNLKDSYIFSDIYGSDHCPIGIDIKII